MKIVVILVTIVLMNCTSVRKDRGITAREVTQWNEMLDLAYPEDVEVRIILEKPSLLQGELLLFRSYIINKTDSVITVVPPANRIRGLLLWDTEFKVLMEKNKEYSYKTGFHIDAISQPGDEKIINPLDSVYINEILWPNNFYSWQERYQRAQRRLPPTGEYQLHARIYLGTKWRPKPARGLFEYSDTVSFTISEVDEHKQNLVYLLDPLVSAFFFRIENMLMVRDSLPEADLPVLNHVRKGTSCMAPLADFVWISSHFVLDSLNVEPVIVEAKRFITEYEGLILAEEMEFILAKILYEKDRTHNDFINHAKYIIATYPKNIGMFEVKKWLEKAQEDVIKSQ